MADDVTPQRLMQLGWGYAPPLILEAAIQTGVFDAIAGGAHSPEAVQAATGASSRGVTALLNALVGLDLLCKDPAGAYRLGIEAETFLVRGRPGYRGDFFRHVSTRLIPSWLHLTEAVRTGTPPRAVNREEEGTPFFSDFVESLFANNAPGARALAAHLDLAARPGPQSVLDLAAGSAVWSIALAEAAPLVEVVAVDWEGVLPTTRRVVARHGLSERYRFVAGDLATAAFGTGHQVAVLGHILHSEGEARSRALLRRACAALAPGGTIAIAEFLVDPDRTGPPLGLMFALNMLLHTEAGSTYSFADIASWLTTAGFIRPRILDAPGPAPLILADKPA
ncbi:MAG: methyltransferase domain-containing protein [Rhodospirillales bacterium]|nr:methyltransferase domain-containing protein [Rhodospirillales bacterium]